MYDLHVKTAKRFGRQVFLFCLLVVFAGCASLSTTPSDTNTRERTITGIEMDKGADTAQIIIHATRELEYSSVKQRNPMGVTFYFPETRIGEIEDTVNLSSELVSDVRATASEDNRNVRVEIGLNADFEYEVEKDDGFLKVSILKNVAVASDVSSQRAPLVSGRSTQEVTRNIPQVDSSASEPNASRTSPQTGSSGGSAAMIQQIDFSAEDDGKSTITIGSARSLDYEIKRIADRRLQLRVFEAKLPEHRKHRPLITTRFDSAVDRVTAVQISGLKDTVDFIVELRELVPFRTESVNGKIIVHFDRSTVAPRPFASANLPSWKQVLEESVEQLMPEGVTITTGLTTPVTEDEGIKSLYDAYFGQPEYIGEKIALDFHETNIKNVFRILQPISGKNYAVDSDVEGQVSISMQRPVPWDQVLDLILTMNRLGMVEHGDIIRIAKLQTLREEEQVQQQRVRDLQKRQEDQQALEPLVTEYIPINYANARAEILPHISDILTENRGRVSVDARNNQIIITDVRGNIRKAREIISNIDKVTPQVIIEARIVEVSTDFSREIGTSWDASRIQSSSTLGGQSGLFEQSVSMNHPVSAASNLAFNFSRLPGVPGQFLLNAQLNAMEEQGKAKIISSPKIVTMDNKTALITQGFEYPYRVRGVAGADPTTEFKDIDLRLEVTPQVTPDDRISLQIHITKDDIDRILPTGEPALSTNEARTELLVDNGNTIVIGGIRKESESVSEEGFPFLKNIPLLGWMFKSKSNVNESRELLIFLTPRIVVLEQRDLVSTIY